MRKLQLLFLVFLCFGSLFCFSQNSKLDSLFQSLNQETVDTLRIKTTYRIARYHLVRGHYDSAYKYATQSYQSALKKGFKRGQANASNTIGTCLIHFSQADSAIHYFQISLKLFIIINDSSQIAAAYNNMGNVYKKTGDQAKSMEFYFKSLQIKEAMGDYIGTSSSHVNISNLYSQMNDSVNALKFALKSLESALKGDDSSHLANVYMSAGIQYRKYREFDKALKYLSESVRISKNTGDRELIAIAAYNLGAYQFDRQDFKAAENNFLVALDYALKYNDLEGIASCYQSLGVIAMNLSKDIEALDYFNKAMEAAKLSGIADLQMNVHERLYQGYEKAGKYSMALNHYKSWRQFKDSLFNEENVRNITRTELNYTHEKEKLLMAAEQQKKDAIATERDKKKNILVLGTVLFLVLLIGFSILLYKRLQENRKQKALIEMQNTEILDSIKYAQKIQKALLANEDLIRKYTKDLLVLYKPKDIVSGDFYWASHVSDSHSDRFYLAVCDSTGHGVPGAFMSVLNIGLLNEAIVEKEIQEPGEVFDFVRKKLVENISQEGQKDGMDGVLLCFDQKQKKIKYAAANLKPLIVRNGEIIHCACDKMPVGKGEKLDPFTSFTLDLHEGDRLYLYTDGFADQFGGPKGKKFMYKQLNQVLAQFSKNSMKEQVEVLSQVFDEWKGQLEQVDDVCLIGIQYTI